MSENLAADSTNLQAAAARLGRIQRTWAALTAAGAAASPSAPLASRGMPG